MFDFDALDEADQAKHGEQENKSAVLQIATSILSEVQDVTPAEEKHNVSQLAQNAPSKVETLTPAEECRNASPVQDLTPADEYRTASTVKKVTMLAVSPSILRVQFVTLGTGVAVELQLPKEISATEVKAMLLMHLNIPVAEQRLLAGFWVWEDACTLGSACSRADTDCSGPMQITVVRVPIAANVALSGSHTGTLRVWDLENATLLKELHGHTGSVNCVAMHWASQCALSGGADSVVRKWDLAQGNAVQELKGHGGAVNCLATSWDKGYAVSGSSDTTLRTWDLDKGKCRVKLEGHSAPITCVAMDEVTWKAISGSEDRSLLVWNLSNGKLVQRCHGHVSPVSCVSLEQNAKAAASGGYGSLKMWALGGGIVGSENPMTIHLGNRGHDDGFNYADLKGHYGPVTCASIDWNTHRGLSGSADTILCFWSPDHRTTAGFRLIPKKLHKHTLPITCLAVDWSTAYAVSGGGDCLWVWDLSKMQTVHALRGPEERGEVICVVMDKR